jgi:hypothetical protein
LCLTRPMITPPGRGPPGPEAGRPRRRVRHRRGRVPPRHGDPRQPGQAHRQCHRPRLGLRQQELTRIPGPDRGRGPSARPPGPRRSSATPAPPPRSAGPSRAGSTPRPGSAPRPDQVAPPRRGRPAAVRPDENSSIQNEVGRLPLRRYFQVRRAGVTAVPYPGRRLPRRLERPGDRA